MSFAISFRPFSFDDVVGQRLIIDVIKKTSKNLPNVTLFSGPHGVGKTTLARMMAAIANCSCEDRSNLPCGFCRDCKMVKNNSHVDVLEFDAASNTGVENIREIIESANYSPIEGKFKVYIIDEVHMLSNSAFNALLKILEEPPKRAMFILATTERSKIPLTVVSRCMNFDLKKLSYCEISYRICEIAESISIKISPEAANLIASVSCGSMRDALFIFEQVSILAENSSIDKNIVLEAISAVDHSKSIDILEAIFFNNLEKIIIILDSLYNQGKCMELVCEGLLSMLNSFLLLHIFADPNSYDEIKFNIPEFEMPRVRDILKNIVTESITRAFQIISNGIKNIKDSPFPLYDTRMLFVTTSFLCKIDDNQMVCLLKKKLKIMDA